MDTRPDGSTPARAAGPVGWLRWIWRQLTSMRTALLLLLLLAIAAVPGSICRSAASTPTRCATYLDQHPTLGPWLDRLGFFDVYASPWFSAIYLLLFVSLSAACCPGRGSTWQAIRARPPRAPRRPQPARPRTPRPRSPASGRGRPRRGRRGPARPALPGRTARRRGRTLAAERGTCRRPATSSSTSPSSVIIGSRDRAPLRLAKGGRHRAGGGDVRQHDTPAMTPSVPGPWGRPGRLLPVRRSPSTASTPTSRTARRRAGPVR